MPEEKVEGIVLRSQEYKERQRIITLFTPKGVLSLVIKGISSKKSDLLALTTPFSHGEYHFIKKNSDLLIFQDGVVINEHLELRQSLQKLKTAGTLAQIILRSQWPGRAAALLFSLYKTYHNHVSGVANWQALVASFYIKLLKLEGFFNPSDLKECSDFQFSAFSAEEVEWITILAEVSRFSSLEEIKVSQFFLEKLQQLFKELALS